MTLAVTLAEAATRTLQNSTQESAHAKINLSLRVVGRRDDGYHLLDSVVVFAGAADTLRAHPADAIGLEIIGPHSATLRTEADNLVLRAAHALRQACGVSDGAQLTLEKNLPVASGIGGGSADAAATLRLLCRLWGIAPDMTLLAPIAAGLGADVPVCLQTMPRRMRGIGEELDTLPPLPECGLLLVNPGIGVATPSVFRARQGGFSDPATIPAAWPDSQALADWLATQPNDLEPPALSLCPVIGTVLNMIRATPHCLLARMSGSGATCFGLYPTPAQAEQAASLITPPDWWRWGGAFAKRAC